MIALAIRLLGPARLRAAGLAYLGGGALAGTIGIAVLLLTPAGQIVQETVLEPVSRAFEQVIAGPTDSRGQTRSTPIADGVGLVGAVSSISLPVEPASGPAPLPRNPEPQVEPALEVERGDIVGDPTITLPLAPAPYSASSVPTVVVSAPALAVPASSPAAPPGGGLGSRLAALARTATSGVPGAVYTPDDEGGAATRVTHEGPGSGRWGWTGWRSPPGIATVTPADSVPRGPAVSSLVPDFPPGAPADGPAAALPSTTPRHGPSEEATSRAFAPGGSPRRNVSAAWA